MAVRWSCPHCEQSMYSAWDDRDKPMVACIHCQKEFENPYFIPSWKEGDSCVR
jgi:hypothetical protein